MPKSPSKLEQARERWLNRNFAPMPGNYAEVLVRDAALSGFNAGARTQRRIDAAEAPKLIRRRLKPRAGAQCTVCGNRPGFCECGRNALRSAIGMGEFNPAAKVKKGAKG